MNKNKNKNKNIDVDKSTENLVLEVRGHHRVFVRLSCGGQGAGGVGGVHGAGAQV